MTLRAGRGRCCHGLKRMVLPFGLGIDRRAVDARVNGYPVAKTAAVPRPARSVT